MQLTSTYCKTNSQAIWFQVFWNLFTHVFLESIHGRLNCLWKKTPLVVPNLLTEVLWKFNLMNSFNIGAFGEQNQSVSFPGRKLLVICKPCGKFIRRLHRKNIVRVPTEWDESWKDLVILKCHGWPNKNRLIIDRTDHTRWLNEPNHCKRRLCWNIYWDTNWSKVNSIIQEWKCTRMIGQSKIDSDRLFWW